MKKITKAILIMLMTILTIIVSSNFTVSNAAEGSKYLTIKMLRKSGYGYKAIEKNVWKIVETNSSGGSVSYDNTIYCLKGGPGFGSSDFGSGNPTLRHYTKYFDMKDPSSIPSPYVNALPNVNSNTYKALLWLLENVYVPAKSGASTEEQQAAKEYRDLLLDNADLAGSYLTDDDIDVVQQLAIWHFTNDGDAFDVGDTGNFELWINQVAGQDSGYNPLSDEKGAGAVDGWDRKEEAKMLYKYLIKQAEANAPNYQVKTASQPYEIANQTQTIREEGNNYIIGPYRINQISDTEGTITATFKNGQGQTLNPTFQNASGGRINSIADTIGKDFYIVVPKTTNVDKVIFSISGSYFNTKITYWAVEGASSSEQPVVIVEREKEDYSDSTEFNKPEDKIFDLALRKFITSINGKAPSTSRVPQISSSTINDLEAERITTATKTHTKTPLQVATGDSVVYTIRVYNEGEIDGKATEITDYLPSGLSLKSGSSINTQYGWKSGSNGAVTTSYLSGQTIKAFNGSTIDYKDVQIECEVTAKVSDANINLKNVAEITGATNDENKPDRDSTPNNLTETQKNNYNPGTSEQGYGYEDDDDYEELVMPGKYFDLALRKFISSVDGKSVNRAPSVDVSKLAAGTVTTATYNHSKTPVAVKVGDEVIYTIRVYNEGQLDGIVTEITDHLPANLEFVNDSFNTSRGWSVSGDGRTVTTNYLSGKTISAFNGSTLDYEDVQIKCKVKDTAVAGEKLTNIAEISNFTDSEGDVVTDRDSQADNVTLPSDTTLPNYKDTEINRGDSYIPGQQDDDDFEKVLVQKFDLALRKFITGVNSESITNRVPVFHNNNGTYTYEHTKDPVEVENGDTVIYTLRIYNEGDIAGYAEEVKDDIPDGLEFLPDNTTNQNYRWVMYDAEGQVTENVQDAVTIRTDYLSKAQADATGRDNLIKAFDPSSMSEPDYKEVRIAFKVTEPNTSDRILINTAEISEDSDENGEPIDDIDSTPDNDKDGEDDIDIEKVKLTYFDLALRKFITKVNGENVEVSREPEITSEAIEDLANRTTTTADKLHTKTPIQVNTGDTVTYTIRVYNEGKEAGYATEVTDYLPEGLRFIEDSQVNRDNGWTNPNGDGRTIVTTALSDDLIEDFDGETIDYVDLEIECEVVATKQNASTSLKNVAEITGEKDSEGNEVNDIDSTPDNLTDDQKNNYNPGTSEQGHGYEDDDDYEELVIPGATGDYEIKLIKQNGISDRLKNATFKIEELNLDGTVINTYDNLTTNDSGEVVTGKIKITSEGTHRYVITETVAPEGYNLLPEPIEIEIDVKLINGSYVITAQRINGEIVNLQVVDGNIIEVTIENNIFDLALRKFITGVNDEEVTNRVPVFHNENGEYTYEHTKDPVEVATNDIVIYTLRIYNEGTQAGYADEVKDDLPEGLEFLPDNEVNTEYRWVMYDAEGNVTENVADAVTIRTDYLSKAQADETGRDNLIDAFDPSTMSEPDYKEVKIAFKVTEPNTSDRIIINTAEISDDSDEDGNPVDDKDSTPDNDEPGEDDIDIEKVKVKYFDLALRKFITGVNDEEVTNRVPIFHNNNGEYTYEHTKDPVEVATGDTIIYTIRVYNEGEIAGYADEVKDDLPEGLEFLPDNEVNTEYRWVMYDANGNETTNVQDAVTIRTDYLSKAQEDETGRDNLIDAFDPETMTQPDYRDVKIAFKVTEPNTSDRVLINTAEISDDSDEDGDDVEDHDSTPDNDKDGEDDIDIEKVKVTYFDLALRKIISKVTMILDGKTYVEQTGHKFEDDPEEVVKVELGNHKIETAVIKFTYQIRITNEGKKAGYAEEITDYIPEGLEFKAEDNEGWTLSKDGKTITTTQLSNTLLQPGDSVVIEVTFRWINGQKNLGVKTNWAEISEDSDENHNPVEDIDSTPNNFKKGEDDIDDASVVLSIVSGVGGHYIGVITGVLVILGTGLVLIRRFVLR